MVALTEEDRRALDYQAQQRRRHANEAARAAALTGNPQAAQALRDAWTPVVMARLEAMSGDDQPEEGACNDLLSLHP
jgi:hypothetical protein